MDKHLEDKIEKYADLNSLWVQSACKIYAYKHAATRFSLLFVLFWVTTIILFFAVKKESLDLVSSFISVFLVEILIFIAYNHIRFILENKNYVKYTEEMNILIKELNDTTERAKKC